MADEKIQYLEKIYKAVANRNRLRIIKLLENGSLCVCDIKRVIGTSQPSVSRHLSILKKAGLVCGWKKGEWVYYRIQKSSDDLITQILQQIFNTLKHEKITGIRIKKNRCVNKHKK